jgi:prepilin-type N-terminal cleavage/methylation domain-containing protein
VRSLLRNRRGFTLLELMIVIAIIGIVLGYVTPRLFGALTSSNIEKTERNMSAIIQLARSSALTHHKTYYVQFNIDDGIVGYFPKPEKSGEEPELEKKMSMPDGVTIKGVKTPYQPKKDRGKAEIKVTPDGVVEQGLIYLEGGINKMYTFMIKPFSGKFKVYDRYVEVAYGRE